MKVKKKSAINCAHSQTLSCDSLLIEFYKEADKVFEYNLEQLDKDLPEEMVTREAAIKKEIVNLEKIVGMLGKAYASTLHQSLEAFKEHISNVHHRGHQEGKADQDWNKAEQEIKNEDSAN